MVINKRRNTSYPSIPLQKAIQRMDEFWKAEGKNAAPVASAVGHWKYGPKSSGGRLTVAALLSFGLLEASGSKENRLVQLTDRALKIQLSPDNTIKEEAIKECAAMPRIYSDLLNKYDVEDLPSDQTISFYLITEKDFNPNTANAFIKNFKDTIRFAKISKSDIISSSSLENNEYQNEESLEVYEQPQHIQTPAKKHYRLQAEAASYPINQQPKGKQVGSSIPVTPTCSMSVIADGVVTQEGLKKLIAYFDLIKDSFPKEAELKTETDANIDE